MRRSRDWGHLDLVSNSLVTRRLQTLSLVPGNYCEIWHQLRPQECNCSTRSSYSLVHTFFVCLRAFRSK
jgi:hypothetical protein